MLGQAEAVECLVDRIALIKAGLTDPTRPLGVFLFVGPTGTGKTEIAKTLGRVPVRLGRPARPARHERVPDAERASSACSATRASPEEAAPLISSVRAQPFSVVLLDEFEKAHRNVWDLFLQVFDDGRLTDRHGRTADFRQLRHHPDLEPRLGHRRAARGIGFVATAGAFRRRRPWSRRVDAGRSGPSSSTGSTASSCSGRSSASRCASCSSKELEQVLERRGLRDAPWAVEWDEAALEFLLEKGFSPELGARPLKRAVERHLLAPLATTIVAQRLPGGRPVPVHHRAATARIEVAFVDPDAASGPELVPAEAPAGRSDFTLGRVALEPEGTEAEAAFLRSELVSLVRRVRSWDEPKQDALAAAREPAFWQSEERHQVLGLIEYIDRLGAATATAERLAARLSSAPTPTRELLELWPRACTACGRARRPRRREASDATVSVRAGKAEDSAACGRFVEDLAAMYVGWADGRRMRVRSSGSDGVVVLEVAGLGAYTLLSRKVGCTCSSYRTTTTAPSTASPCSSMSSPTGTAGTVRNRRIGESRRSCGDTGTNPHRSFATPPGCARAGSTAFSQATSTCSQTRRPTSGYASFSRTSWLTAEPSARPATCGITSAITRPMSRMLVAPTSAITSSTIASRSSSDERLGHELLEHVELVLLLLGLLLPAAGAKGLGRLEPLLALALQHLQLLVVGAGGAAAPSRRPEGWRGSGAARRGARHRPRASRSSSCFLDLCDQTHCVLFKPATRGSSHPARANVGGRRSDRPLDRR